MWSTYYTRQSLTLIIIKLGDYSIPAVSAQNQNVCFDLEDMIRRANPSVLTNCARDAECTQVSCETIGTAASVFTSIEIGLAPCPTPPEVIIQLYRGEALVHMSRNPARITNVRSGFGVTVLDVFLDFIAATVVRVGVSHACTCTDI